jgi:hypothetical protein
MKAVLEKLPLWPSLDCHGSIETESDESKDNVECVFGLPAPDMSVTAQVAIGILIPN